MRTQYRANPEFEVANRLGGCRVVQPGDSPGRTGGLTDRLCGFRVVQQRPSVSCLLHGCLSGWVSGGAAQRRIHACMAMPAATPALMERVEPY